MSCATASWGYSGRGISWCEPEAPSPKSSTGPTSSSSAAA